jgi:hypothetical protein
MLFGIVLLGVCVTLILFAIVMIAGLVFFLVTGFMGIFTKSGRIDKKAGEEE